MLGGRTTLRVTGDVTLNGERLVKHMKRKIAYVMQQDVFFEHLTVREQLTFIAQLRFPRGMKHEQKLAQVNATIQALGITKCAESPIMFVSGGERKRVNIGSEVKIFLAHLCFPLCFRSLLSSSPPFPCFSLSLSSHA